MKLVDVLIADDSYFTPFAGSRVSTLLQFSGLNMLYNLYFQYFGYQVWQWGETPNSQFSLSLQKKEVVCEDYCKKMKYILDNYN